MGWTTSRGALIAALALTGCLESPAVQCDGFVCPPGELCDDDRGQCVLPGQLEACDGLVDGEPCSFTGVDEGVCADGVCVAAACGNGVVDSAEQCEPGVAIPTSCVELGLDFGHLGCDAGCELEIGCDRIGWSSIGVTGVELLGVFGLGADDAFAVSTAGEIFRYNGEAWTPMPAPPALLRAVWAAGPDSAVAVGNQSNMIGSPAVALHYDGADWTETVLPGETDRLRGVFGTAADDVYAVGDAGTIWRFDGTDWREASTPGTAANLNAVWASGPGDLFAAGAGGVVVHSGDGDVWTPQTTPTGEALLAMWGRSATDVFAVGTGGATLRSRDGQTWSLDAVDAEYLLTGVSGGATSALAVGQTLSGRGVVMVHDGDRWIDLRGAVTIPLEAVWTDGGGAQIAVGELGTIARSTGSSWSQVPPPGFAIAAVAVDGARVAVAGAGGWYDGDRAGDFGAGPVVGGDFLDLVAHPGGAVVAVGAAGLAARDAVIERAAGSGPDLRAIALRPGGEVAVGDAGQVLLGSGAGWSVECSAAADPCAGVVDLRGVAAIGDEIFAVGDMGAIAHFDGADWTLMMSNTTATLRGVYAAAADDVFAAGDGGLILHYDGADWTAMPPATTATLHRITGTGGTDVFAVGDAATILHHDGATWAPVRPFAAGAHIGLATTDHEVLFATRQSVVHLVRSVAW